MSSKRAPGEARIIVEMIKHGISILSQLKLMYNKFIIESHIPDDRLNALVVLIFKKGNKYKLEKYRLIRLLYLLYKLFTRIITQRITNKIDNCQPPGEIQT